GDHERRTLRTDDLDEAHAAVARDREAGVIAEVRDLRGSAARRLEHREPVVDVVLRPVDRDRDRAPGGRALLRRREGDRVLARADLAAHGAAPASGPGLPTVAAPPPNTPVRPFLTRASNSDRNFAM